MPRRRPTPEEDARARDWAYDQLRAGICARRAETVSVTRRFCLFLYVPLLGSPWVAVDDDSW